MILAKTHNEGGSKTLAPSATAAPPINANYNHARAVLEIVAAGKWRRRALNMN